MNVKFVCTIIGAAAVCLAIGLAVPRAFSQHSAVMVMDNAVNKNKSVEQLKQDNLRTYQLLTIKSQKKEVMEVDNYYPKDRRNNSIRNTRTAAKEKARKPEPKEIVVKDQWIQNKIDENRDKISDEDLEKGAEIFNSLDTDYLFGLAEGGLTEEEKLKAQTYLSENLTDEQYAIAQELYFKYVGLLNEE